MRYKVTLNGGRASEYVIEAKGLREASKLVKTKYPDHLGYSIKQDN